MSWNKKLTFCLLGAFLAVSMSAPHSLCARDTFVRDLIEGLSDQSENRNSVTAQSPSDSGAVASLPVQSQAVTGKEAVTNVGVNKKANAIAPGEVLFPGISSVDVLSDSLVKLASLSPTLDQNVNSLSVLDSHERLGSFGKLASEPINLYSNFLIEVDRSTYTVELSGFRENGEKNLLYSCKAGLGSPEYPTPRGTFYILRIFDDKPLWIPPQDREWAYGQVPSRSVYGGHMMPFFSKYSALSNRRNEIVMDDEDVIAAPIKMVDAGAYRIHGTDSPWSIGSGQSHGCVRLLNKTVAQLADTLKMYVGTTTRGQTANGIYINLAKPVKLVLR